MEEPKRLYRSNNGMIAGVCAGIAEYLYGIFRGDRLPDPLDGYT